MRGTIQYVFFCAWPISFSFMVERVGITGVAIVRSFPSL